ALDMLFAPGSAWTGDPSWQWGEIRENRDRLLTRKSLSFIGYAQRQANKYGIKGSRVAAARGALALLDEGIAAHGGNARLETLHSESRSMIEENEHMGLVGDVTAQGREIHRWEVCGRKMPYTASILNARDIMARIVDEYGRRALMAESQQGVDW